jgi:8-oxo-dGTP pyrophosphatase MutT (NUDIX family)
MNEERQRGVGGFLARVRAARRQAARVEAALAADDPAEESASAARQLEKVTAFVTRGVGSAAELLVFHHPRGGVQVPAGTVEVGEAPADAAVRELAEETGLMAVRLVQALGREVDDLAPESRAVLRTEALRSAPSDDAPLAGGIAYRGLTVPCSGEENGYARVGLLEWEDLAREPRVLASEQWGWVPVSSMCTCRVREFFHFATTDTSADAWSQQTTDGGGFEFAVYWVPLVPQPRLVAEQNAWVESWHEALLHGVGP